ncbi:AAA family ATPase [Catenovulum agarivorans]|uniref:AAA family ATPase n=1 Tax=Catenovulum agarivorans TaxID=1172192 RepID=UPI0002D307F4|nr:AAA family ATPase [Catenovulum agarivorans]
MDKFNNFTLCDISIEILNTMTNEEKHGFNSIIDAVKEQFPKADIYTAKLASNRLNLSIGIKPMPQSGQRDKAAVNFFRISSNNKGFFIAYNRDRGQVNRINEKINGKARGYYLGDGEQVQAFIAQLQELAQNDEAKNLLNGQGCFPNDYAKHKDDKLDPFFSEHFKPSHIEKILKFSEIKQQNLKKVYLDLRKIFPQCDFYVRQSGFVLCCGKIDGKENAPVVIIEFSGNDNVSIRLNRNIARKNPNIAPEFKARLMVGTQEYNEFLKFLVENYREKFEGERLNPKETEDRENSSEEDNVGDYNELKAPLNQVLYGPPGTGKTYHTIEAAVKAINPHSNNFDNREALKKEYAELVANGQIQFVTFHQSYGYEEFVEGLTAKSESGQLVYEKKDGIFKRICTAAHNARWQLNDQINPDAKIWKLSIESAQDNSSKKYCLDNGLAAIGWGDLGDLNTNVDSTELRTLGKNNQNSVNNFTKEMKIGDLVMCIDSSSSVNAIGVVTGDYKYEPKGIPSAPDYKHQRQVHWLHKGKSVEIKSINDGKGLTQATCYPLSRLTVGSVLELLKSKGIKLEGTQENQNPDKYVLIIDEINRGNISKIFGELITLIEPSKRFGADECIEITLPYSDAGDPKFSVPNNLYIIGTMNTADRSLALMDTALRRRFDFIEMMPDYSKLKDTKINTNNCVIDVAMLLRKLNDRIEALYDREHTLGHAFFMPIKDILEDKKLSNEQALTELSAVFKNKIIPLLQEYFFEDWNKIRLVLGDNQKANSELQFTREKDNDFNTLFGDDLNTNNTFNQPDKAYELQPFSEKVWANPQAYRAIYAPKVTSSSVKNIENETAPVVVQERLEANS